MKKKLEYYIIVNNKKFSYSLKKISNTTSFVNCEAANIAQEFLNEDVPDLLRDLPNLILAEIKYKNNQEQVIRFRITVEDKKLIMKRAYENGYKTISGYLRDLAIGKKTA